MPHNTAEMAGGFVGGYVMCDCYKWLTTLVWYDTTGQKEERERHSSFDENLNKEKAMNIRNMKTLRGQIARLKDAQFCMSTYITHPEEGAEYLHSFDLSCGTVGCVAGWAFMLNGKDAEAEVHPETWAQRWLELSHTEAKHLFFAEAIRKKMRESEDDALPPLSSITRVMMLDYMDEMIAHARQ